jgi:hypothetical protein
MNNFSVLFSSLVQGLNLCVRNEGDKENKCMVDFNLKVLNCLFFALVKCVYYRDVLNCDRVCFVILDIADNCN